MRNKNIIYKYYKGKNTILVVYSFINGKYFFYDGLSADLLHCYLRHEELQIVELMKENLISNEDFSSFISEFNYIIEDVKKITNNSIEKESQESVYEDIFTSGYLYSFHLDITKHCNLRCVHCYHTFDKYDSNDLDINEIKKLLKALSKIGVFKIIISGGEPLFRKDFYEILEFGKNLGFIFEVYSNGTLCNEIDVIRMKELNVSLLSLSFYGNEQSTIRITQSKTAYSRLFQCVNYCKKHDLLFEFKYIITKENIDDIKEYRKYCYDNAIPLSFELSLTPQIDGSTTNLGVKITKDDYYRIIRDNRDIMLYGKVSKDMYGTVCDAGYYSLYCDYKGDIYPCVSYRKRLGSYKDVQNIWADICNGKILRRIHKNDLKSYQKYSFCNYCYQICPGLSMLENKDVKECYNSGCVIASVVEDIQNEHNL